MDKLVINGGSPLYGEIKISGAKNAVLPIMAATIIQGGIYRLENVPKLKDTYTMKKLLEMIGAKVSFTENIMIIDTSSCDNPVAPYELVKTMRASFYVLGPFLSRFNYAEVSLPGGCAWGPRPVNYHLEAMESLGVEVELDEGMMKLKGNMVGNEINFIQKSVGATGNAIMAAVKAKGVTIINNASIEPEIESLCEFLILMGANIDGVGTEKLVIVGKKKLHTDITYKIIPDRIEAGTFLIAAAITNGEIILNCVNALHMKILLEYLKKTGYELSIEKNSIKISPKSRTISPVNIVTSEYPGFPTDLQAQWMALMTKSNSSSTIVEKIYPDRYTHIAELRRLGAKINLNDNVAYINGNSELKGAPVMSTDIRASASLIIAALAAKGETTISRIYHIDRGYEKIESKLIDLKADIKRIND